MAEQSNRDALLRRKNWMVLVEVLWLLLALALALAGATATAMPMRARVILVAVGAILYVFGLFFVPSRWVRCLRCAYPIGKLSLRRKKTLQINVCPHCGLALDAPLEHVRAP